MDSECCARLADFGLAVISGENTTGCVADNNGIKGTIRWMAPELLLPDNFGFTGNHLKQLPSRSTDIYAIGMTILEVSAHPCRLKLQAHFLAGYYGVPSIQRCPQHWHCHVQGPEWRSAL